jgi:hypothetical protein
MFTVSSLAAAQEDDRAVFERWATAGADENE